MRFQLECPVRSVDGVDLGKIRRIVFNRRSAEVKSIVITEGVAFARDVAVPIRDVQAATAKRVELSLSGEEVDRLPNFVGPESVIEREVQHAAENTVVGEGSEVLTNDGDKVGEVLNVVINPASHKPSSLVVRGGLMLPDDLQIPGDWIESCDDYGIKLNVARPAVEAFAATHGKDQAWNLVQRAIVRPANELGEMKGERHARSRSSSNLR
jgi:sporulation protein YlmC with PRC-barrel domain